MGVIRNQGNRVSNKITEFVESDVDEFSIGEEYPPGSPEPEESAHFTRRRGRAHSALPLRGVSERNTSRRLGVKKSRRNDNVNHLLSLIEEEDLDDLDMVGILPISSSVFTQLLQESDKMQVWNDFINSNEEEQVAVLQKFSSRKNDNDAGQEQSGDDSALASGDNRNRHPAFSSQEAFQNISCTLRSMLKRRHLPKGFLMHLEEELLDFFEECPCGIYISDTMSSYERCILHALCQYNTLKSQSFGEGGERRTHVENCYSSFCPPKPVLSDYIDFARNNH